MQTNLESTLSKLIAIPTLSKDTAACREIITSIRDELAPYKLFIQADIDASSPWLIATTKDTKQPDILLAAHLDVVPAPNDMFVMQKRDDKLYGRGVHDMKFAAACYLEFFKTHADKLHELNIGILFTTDEEAGSDSMHDVMATGLRAGVVLLPDGGDNWAIEKRAKGYSMTQLTSRGKTAHGSRPWEGKNALHALVDVLQILRAKYPASNPDDATLQVNMLQAGEAPNQIPNYASAKIDFRSFSKQELDDYQLFITNLAQAHDLEVSKITGGDPVIFDEHTPAVQSFLQAFRDQLGISDIPFSDSYGGTDARFFVEHGIPCIIVEPHSGGRHSTEEWLLADDLTQYYQLIERWLLTEAK